MSPRSGNSTSGSTGMVAITPEIREEARRLTEGCGTDLEKVRRLAVHMFHHYGYCYPPRARGATAMGRDQRGDCGQFSALFAAWCRFLRYDRELVPPYPEENLPLNDLTMETGDRPVAFGYQLLHGRAPYLQPAYVRLPERVEPLSQPLTVAVLLWNWRGCYEPWQLRALHAAKSSSLPWLGWPS